MLHSISKFLHIKAQLQVSIKVITLSGPLNLGSKFKEGGPRFATRNIYLGKPVFLTRHKFGTVMPFILWPTWEEGLQVLGQKGTCCALQNEF